MTHDDLIRRMVNDLRAYSDYLSFRYPETSADTHTDSDSAIVEAEADVGATLPIADKVRESWFVKRVKRHLLQIVLDHVALKYQAKAFSTHQQFDHLKAMIETMDNQWEAARSSLTDGSASACGAVYDTGIRYDRVGREYESCR